AYSEASKDVFAVFERTAPAVEALSIDEAFLDTRGLERIAGSPPQIAERLRSEVRQRVGLPITVGVASTKFLAKVASAVAKPDGLLVVPPDGELEFLHPLAVERLWGVGAVTARKLRERGLVTVGQVARLPQSALVSVLGPAAGRHLHALANNRDPRRVRARSGTRRDPSAVPIGRHDQGRALGARPGDHGAPVARLAAMRSAAPTGAGAESHRQLVPRLPGRHRDRRT